MYVVFRDVEEREREVLVELGITAFYMADVDRLGIVKVVDEALASVDPLGNRNILLSFYIDALDPVDAHATGTAVRGGLTMTEGMTLCDMVYMAGSLKAVDMVEVNPGLASNLGEATRTVNAANNIL